jgi:hypothetical protein
MEYIVRGYKGNYKKVVLNKLDDDELWKLLQNDLSGLITLFRHVITEFYESIKQLPSSNNMDKFLSSL